MDHVRKATHKKHSTGGQFCVLMVMASGPITAWEIYGETVEQCQTLLFGAPKSLQMVTAAMKLKDGYSLEEKL